MTHENIDPADIRKVSQLANDFTQSLHYDRRLYREDIAISIAHARMLEKQRIIPSGSGAKIIEGLQTIASEIDEGIFNWKPDLEDIHMNIESRLHELIGETAGHLHTARSRNDQVATGTRLWVKKTCIQILEELTEVQYSLLSQIEKHVTTILPGYTHLQRGQPVVLAHHLLAYFEMFERDKNRILFAKKAADVMPLGSGALAGVPYPIDRNSVAKELGFNSISLNSMDAVSDRDFSLDFLHAVAVSMTHLSRLAEELIIWSSDEFGFVKIPDQYTTGSSIMPQKRNPDFAELIRGKTGRVFGSLFALFTILKGLPLTYNRDLQEDKESVFDSADTLLKSLSTMKGMMKDLEINVTKMEESAKKSYVIATDIADYLVGKGVPFRKAYTIISELARKSIESNKGFGQLTFNDFKIVSDLFEEDVMQITIESSVESRSTLGGTSPKRVKDAIVQAKSRLKNYQNI